MPTGDPPRLFDGRYHLLGRLGAGGMATVWLADDTSLHRKVAIKVLAERYAEDEQFVERFRREAQSAAGLNHPNIVAIYDRGVAEGTYYIAMEYLDGPTLKAVIDERGGLDPTRAIGFATQILSALRFAHNHGVVHRDIKPHNVVVAPDGRLKVTDFGIARAGASQMTEVGSIVGTAQYLSPEQARGEVVGPPSDLYSVGIVLYEMLTGRVPFEGDSAVAIAMKHLGEEPVPPSAYAPGTPPALEQVVLRALAKDAGDRYQTAEEMAADLDRARRGVALSPRTEQMTRVIAPSRTASQTRVEPPRDATRVWDRGALPPRAPTPPPAPVRPRRSRWPWVLLVLLVLAAAAVAALALSGIVGGDNGHGSTTPTSVVVPSDLVGSDQFDAVDELNRLKLKAKRNPVYSDEDPGKVISTRPRAGASIAPGTLVTLNVSRGAKLVAVPKLKGLTVDDATTALGNVNLQSKETDSYSLEDKGTVIAQNPAQGSLVAPSSTVAITVSLGPKSVGVPDITGRDIPIATTLLKGQGLELGKITYTSSTTQPAKTIISSDPPSGTETAEGTQVAVVVSTGYPTVPMPDVIGDTPEEASQQIQTAGLVPFVSPTPIIVTDPDQDGKVVKTSPSAGHTPRQTSRVIIRVGSYSAPTTDTTTTPTTPTDTTPIDTTTLPQTQ